MEVVRRASSLVLAISWVLLISIPVVIVSALYKVSPSFVHFLYKKFRANEDDDMPDLSTAENFLFNPYEFLRNQLKANYISNSKTAELNGPAPNPEVIDLVTKKVKHLLDYQKKGRPLVLNFGSCT